MPEEMMYGEAMAIAIIEEMQRDADVVFYGQNMAMTERDSMLKMFGKNRVRLRADFRDRRDWHCRRRRHHRIASHRRALDERVHAGGYGPGAQRGSPPALYVRWSGESSAGAEGRATDSPPAGVGNTPIASITP